MKVLDVYHKSDYDKIVLDGKVISREFDKFFAKFPSEYRINYDRNLADLEIWKVDEFPDYSTNGEYYWAENTIIISNCYAIYHELIHMSHYDRIRNAFAIEKREGYSLCEVGIIEGMTEYLKTVVSNYPPTDYFFETFVARMIASYDGVVKSFFIPSRENFISSFPNKRDIYSLMYSLNFYNEKIKILMNEKKYNCLKKDVYEVRNSISNVIDSLIDIELSFDNSRYKRKLYSEKFMDLLSDENIKDYVGNIYKDYRNYAYGEVKRRILRRM